MIGLLRVPYHLGRAGIGMGAGPDRLLSAGFEGLLHAQGLPVTMRQVELPGPFQHEIGAYFGVQMAVARHIRDAVEQGDFPFVLGGDCGCVLGATAGLSLGGQAGGVIWFDAHGDMNTPETTTSGFLDGMPVAVLTGGCWAGLAASIPGMTVLPTDHLLLAGARALDDHERDFIRLVKMPFVGPEGLGGIGSEFSAAVSELAERVESVHVHVDLDVIDISDGRANEFAADGGPTLDALDAALRVIGAQISVNSVSLTSYNPAVDLDGRALSAGLRLGSTLAGLSVPD